MALTRRRTVGLTSIVPLARSMRARHDVLRRAVAVKRPVPVPSRATRLARVQSCPSVDHSTMAVWPTSSGGGPVITPPVERPRVIVVCDRVRRIAGAAPAGATVKGAEVADVRPGASAWRV